MGKSIKYHPRSHLSGPVLKWCVLVPPSIFAEWLERNMILDLTEGWREGFIWPKAVTWPFKGLKSSDCQFNTGPSLDGSCRSSFYLFIIKPYKKLINCSPCLKKIKMEASLSIFMLGNLCVFLSFFFFVLNIKSKTVSLADRYRCSRTHNRGAGSHHPVAHDPSSWEATPVGVLWYLRPLGILEPQESG